jgi:hypothetical protein
LPPQKAVALAALLRQRCFASPITLWAFADDQRLKIDD